MITVRIPTSDDVSSDVDLANYIRANMQILARLGWEYAVMSAVVRSMLKDADKVAGKRRRFKVARPLAMAAGTLALASAQVNLVNRRFREAYAAELQASRTHTRRRPANAQMRFEAA
jgi:hypothetical protein